MDTYRASDLAGGDALPKARPLTARAAGEDTLLSDKENGKVHFINATAALIWECCDGKTTLDECMRHLREKFAAPPEADITADVRAVLADLEKRGLFAGGAPDA